MDNACFWWKKPEFHFCFSFSCFRVLPSSRRKTVAQAGLTTLKVCPGGSNPTRCMSRLCRSTAAQEPVQETCCHTTRLSLHIMPLPLNAFFCTSKKESHAIWSWRAWQLFGQTQRGIGPKQKWQVYSVLFVRIKLDPPVHVHTLFASFVAFAFVNECKGRITSSGARPAYSHMQRSNQCFQYALGRSGNLHQQAFFNLQKNRNLVNFSGVSCIFYILLWLIHNTKCAHITKKTQTQSHNARCESALRERFVRGGRRAARNDAQELFKKNWELGVKGSKFSWGFVTKTSHSEFSVLLRRKIWTGTQTSVWYVPLT